MAVTRCRAPGARCRAGGFTLVEVLVSLLIGMIGLLGTLAVQQTLLGASQAADDAAVAMRLAMQTVEEINVRKTDNQGNDQLAPLATGLWSAPIFLDANGRTSNVQTGPARWQRRIRVTNLGAALPYNVSVEIAYSPQRGNIDSSNIETFRSARLDIERRKWW